MFFRVAAAALFLYSLHAQELRSGYWNGRPVVFVEQDGWAVAEGDILLGRADEIAEGPAESSSSKSSIRKAIGRSSPAVRWPDGVVPYIIAEDVPNQKRITDAIEHWSTHTPVRLIERTTEANYIRFIRPSAQTTCSSFVGMIGRDQAINIGDQCSSGNTIHEIGHAIGLHHEQARHDRDLFLKTNFENADKRTLSNFNQQLSGAEDIGPYDHTSIMHYDIFGFSRNGLPVFETIPPGIPVSQREALSPADIASVKQMYGWPVDTVTVSTNPFGLRIVVDGEVHTSPASFRWEPGSRHTVAVDAEYDQNFYRYKFHGWNDGGAREHTITVAPDMPVYSANFVRYGLLSVAQLPNGTVTVEPSSEDGYYPEGTVISLRAAANEGFLFSQWTGVIFTNHGLAQNPVRISMRAPVLNYRAIFVRPPLTTITSEPTGLRVVVDGTTITTPRNYQWLPGSAHEVKVEAATQNGGLDTYRNTFIGWSDDGDTAHSVEATDQHEVFTARFQTQYLVARGSAAGGFLEFSPAFTNGYFDAGTALQLSPSGNGANRFVAWTGDAIGTDNPFSVVVDDHKLVGASFQAPRVINSIVNAATRIPFSAVAPGELAMISGLEIGPEDGDPAKVRVMFQQSEAAVVRASRDQVTVIVPEALGDRTDAMLTVVVPGNPGAARTVSVLPAVPGVFTSDESGKGQARAWNEDGSENNNEAPAMKGGAILILATGVRSGSELTARIAGRNASVESVSSPEGGVVQVRLRIPQDLPSGPVPVVIRSAGESSLGSVFLSVR